MKTESGLGKVQNESAVKAVSADFSIQRQPAKVLRRKEEPNRINMRCVCPLRAQRKGLCIPPEESGKENSKLDTRRPFKASRNDL